MKLRFFRIVVAMVLIAAARPFGSASSCTTDGREAGENLIYDPSFEEPKEKDRWGHVFAKWSGWMYEGECEFRVSEIARTGKHSLLLAGGNNPKIRACPAELVLEPGR